MALNRIIERLPSTAGFALWLYALAFVVLPALLAYKGFVYVIGIVIFAVGIHPNIDDMLLSAAGIGMCGCAAVLTGMGTDGANGLLACRQAGFETWAQDEQTSVVYGMPKAAAELSAAKQIAAPSEIGASINRTIMQLLNTGSAK